MATNKHAKYRYQTLDKFPRNLRRRYYINYLIEGCNNPFLDLLELINNQSLNETKENQLTEVILTLSSFKEMPHFELEDEISARLDSSKNLTNGLCVSVEIEEYVDNRSGESKNRVKRIEQLS